MGKGGYFITRQRLKHPTIECLQVIIREFELGRAEQLAWSEITNVFLSRIVVLLPLFLCWVSSWGSCRLGSRCHFGWDLGLRDKTSQFYSRTQKPVLTSNTFNIYVQFGIRGANLETRRSKISDLFFSPSWFSKALRIRGLEMLSYGSGFQVPHLDCGAA